jgi:hypothetical protein
MVATMTATAHRLPGEPRCPACGAILDGATSVDLDGAMPRPGDVSICAYCASLLVYSDELHPRFPTDAELVDITADPGVRRAQAAALAFIAERGPR